MRHLTMADGSQLDAAMCGASGGVLVVEPLDMDFVQAATVFSNPDKTATIECDYGSEIHETFTGFTELVGIYNGLSDHMTVSLRKG